MQKINLLVIIMIILFALGCNMNGTVLTPNGHTKIDTSSGNATASEILFGYKAWVDGLEITGTYLPLFGNFMASSIYREVGKTRQLTLSEEIATGDTLPEGYRAVPDINKDDDGHDDTSPLAKTKAIGPDTPCGKTQKKISSRIADCLLMNSTKATWNGEINGISGESIWKLITYTITDTGAYQVWIDTRTGLIWSDNLGKTNWCKASGNVQNDPFLYCNDNKKAAESWCAEAHGLNTPTAYDDMKGKMRSDAKDSSPSVFWRLPTIYDWEQANIDGIRFVFPSMKYNWYWSASVLSEDRHGAWVFSGANGYIEHNYRNSDFAVACVGRGGTWE